MKECPNCKKEFADDLFFCLFDGTPLTAVRYGVDHTAPTEVDLDPTPSLPTEVFPRPGPLPATPGSKLPYAIIAILMMACVVLAAALLFTNLGRFLGTGDPQANNAVETKTVVPRETQPASPTPIPANTMAVSTPIIKQPAVNVDPAGKWKGKWSTTSGTLLDIEISLTDKEDNRVDGQIKWTMRKTVRPDKIDKIGLSAIEFVRGEYDPATRSLTMSGYAKDDPNDVLVMVDDYRLTVSSDGKALNGKARNGGKWNGYLSLSR